MEEELNVQRPTFNVQRRIKEIKKSEEKEPMANNRKKKMTNYKIRMRI